MPESEYPGASAPEAASTLKVLSGAAIGAGCGYLVTTLAARKLGPVGYQPFGAYWSALYLIVATLSGFQQEVTRACRRSQSAPSDDKLMPRFLGLNVLLVAVAATAVAALLAPQISPSTTTGIAFSLVVGAIGYLLVAVLSGTLFGLGLLTHAAILTASDGIIRIVSYLVISSSTTSLFALAIGVALPFAIAALLLWFAVRRSIVGKYRIDVSSSQLTRQSWQVVLGTMSSGVVLSGIPLVLGVVATPTTQAEIGSLTLLIILTRSPIVLPLMAVQSLLITRFRTRSRLVYTVTRMSLVSLLIGALLSGIAAAIGPWLLRSFVSPDFVAHPLTVAMLVMASVAIAVLCISGPATIASGLQRAYAGGWAVAAVFTVAGIVLPLGSMTDRAIIGMTCGPLAGAVVHFWALWRVDNRTPRTLHQ